SVTREVENRVADELPGAMEGDVTPALDLEDVDALATQDVRGVGGATQGHHRWVLKQQEEVVRQPPIDASLGEGALPRERLGVRNEAGFNDLDGAIDH